ncbi:MAG: hypothetical protein D6772_06375 [Bacteroidetes bacterium]|nr:MAG: hypothetical protein D6772_06375 [Bacteroidota bacterium]
MIGKVKQWLGIEGVKLEIWVPPGQTLANRSLHGKIRLQSMHPQTVTGIRIVLIERYARGRGEDRLIDEFELGSTTINQTFTVAPEQAVVLDFQLPFQVVESEVDRWGKRNALNRQLARAARWLHKADSQYRVEAEAKVQGVALNPFDKKEVDLK